MNREIGEHNVKEGGRFTCGLSTCYFFYATLQSLQIFFLRLQEPPTDSSILTQMETFLPQSCQSAGQATFTLYRQHHQLWVQGRMRQRCRRWSRLRHSSNRLVCASNGVALENRNDVTIRNLLITGFTAGILLNTLLNNIIDENTVVSFANSNDGISILNGSTNNTIFQNYLYGTVFLGHGIYIEQSAGNKFRNNTLSNGQRSYFWPSTNKFNFYIESSNTSSPADLIQDIDSSKILDGKPMCYWVNQHNKVIPSDVAYIVLVNRSGMTMQDLNLTDRARTAPSFYDKFYG